MEQEIWKDIPWYEGIYKISSEWSIFSFKYNRNIYRCKSTYWKYKSIVLFKDWNKIHTRLHRLIAITFIANEENNPYVNHINWIKSDNRLNNLEWCSPSYNSQHSYDNWLSKKYWKWKTWIVHPRSIGVVQMDISWKVLNEYDSMWDASRDTGIKRECICLCCKWKIKTSWGYKWMYK